MVLGRGHSEWLEHRKKAGMQEMGPGLQILVTLAKVRS